MSGDVQPRKRKDKKKKRDDSDNKAAEFLARKMSVRDDDEPKEKPSTGVHATKMGPDDIQLHVQSDHGTGGHWCAKILFFSLMAVLVGLIGLILLENRGITDLDTPLSESRYADYLEGWVDEKRESHDEHDVLKSLNELDGHEHDNEPFAEEEDHDDADDDHDGDHDDEEDDDHNDDEDGEHNDENEDQNDDQADDNDNEENGEDEEEPEVDRNNDDDDGDEGDDEDNNQDRSDDDEEGDDKQVQGQDNDDDDLPENEESYNAKVDDNDNSDDNEDDNDNNDNDDNDDNNTDEDKQYVETKEKFNTADDNDVKDEGFEDQDDDDDNSPFEEHVAKSSIDPKSTKTTKAYISLEELEAQVDELYEHVKKLEESLDMPKIVADKESHLKNFQQRKEDDNDESNEEVIDNDKGEDLHLQKLTQKEAADNNNDDDEQSEESSSLTVKLAVGLALVAVAHLVLVKRSKSNEEELIESSHIESNELKRRLTLITETETIPSDVDDEQPNDEDDDDYDDDDIKDEIENVEDESNVVNLDDDENEDVEYSEGDEQEDEEEEEEKQEEDVDVDEDEGEPVEQVAAEVDTFNQMKSMYRPKNDTQPLINEEKVEVKTIVKNTEKVNVPVPDDEEEYEEDEEDVDALDSENEDVEDEEDDEEGDVSDVDDNDLMKRLESKYGKLPDSKTSDDDEVEEKWTKVKRTGPQYNDDDFEEELRRTNALLEDNPTFALKLFEFLIEIKPNSSKAWHGKGKALDLLSEKQKSNEILKQAIAAYVKAIEFGSLVDNETFRNCAERCIDRMRFIGQHLKAVTVHDALIERFNDDPYFRNQLAVTYLLINRLSDAKLVLHETLLRWRHDGFALVHYGFVLKNLDKNNEAAAVFLQEGIDSNAEGTNDGRFYFNLGEALTRLGRNDEAMAVYRKGAAKKLLLSEYQRSLYNVDRLESRPFWTKKETGYKRFFDVLEQNWEKIRDEGLSVLNDKGHFTDESENLRDIGDWKQFDLFARGRKMVKHCLKTPFTCKIIETFPAARFCARGQVKFSVMHPNTHVWPHCGPTNCRLRAHLGLKVPQKTFIRVATETRSWKEGQMLIFDDSFEHEVWHNGTSVRFVLIVDVWHPDLTEEERTNLYPI